MQVSGGSSDGIFFIRIWGNRFNKARWFRLTVMSVYLACRSVHNGKWWLKCRLIPKHRMHVVYTGLEPGWHDEDERMLHACMALLGQYVKWHGGAAELEKFSSDLRSHPDQNAPAGLDSGQADRQDEATTIWRWWTEERPRDQAREEELLHILYGHRQLRFKPTENPNLSELEMDEFAGDEVALNAEHRALQAKIHDDEQKMLHRLIDIRPSLWT